MGREMIYTDPHHGLTLKAHTTRNSRDRFRQYIADHTKEVLDSAEESFSICAGDFFHEFDNSSQVLNDSYQNYLRTDVVLEGNHDVSTVKGAASSLEFFGNLHGLLGLSERVGRAEYNVPSFRCVERGGRDYWMMPHQTTQGIFDEALEYIREAAATSVRETGTSQSILILHSNYANPFAAEETSLNLTRRQAEVALTVFDLVIVGHEHKFRTDFSDRLIVLGSPHPTNFGDICEKFILEIGEDGEPCLTTVWDPADHYYEASWRDPLPSGLTDIHFVKLTGEAAAGEAPQLAKAIQAAWTTLEPFAVKSEVQIIKPKDNLAGTLPDSSTWNILERVTSELKTGSPDQYQLWKEITNDK